MQCYKCGHEIQSDRKIFRQDTCPKCDSYLHCCLNCRFYDKVAYHECHESQADLVKDKEMANYCDYFEQLMAKRAQPSGPGEARRNLDELFKKQPD